MIFYLLFENRILKEGQYIDKVDYILVGSLLIFKSFTFLIKRNKLFNGTFTRNYINDWIHPKTMVEIR